MANYNCAIRTNYFRVNNNEEFEKFINHVVGEDMYVFDSQDKDGNKLYGFGCYGNIYGYREDSDDYDEECDYDKFIDGLQKHLVDNDAVIIFEAGNEKLRYVVGSVTVITKDGVEYEDVTNLGLKMAKKMLNDPEYKTQVDY